MRCCAMAKTISARHGACQDDRKILRWEAERQNAGFPLAAEWRDGSVFRNADWGGDTPTSTIGASRSPQAGHCLRGVDQGAVSGVTVQRRERAVRRSQNRIIRAGGSRVWQRTWGIACGLNLHLDASATMCLVTSQRIGQGRSTSTCRICGDTGGLQVRQFRHEERSVRA